LRLCRSGVDRRIASDRVISGADPRVTFDDIIPGTDPPSSADQAPSAIGRSR
jgi:hypothetical protein